MDAIWIFLHLILSKIFQFQVKIIFLAEIQQLQSHSADKSFTAWAAVADMMETAVDFETSWGVLAKILFSLKIEVKS